VAARSTPVTERLALKFMRRQPNWTPAAPSDDPIHLLNPAEREALRRIERQAIVRAAIAGALSGAASFTAALLANRGHPIDGSRVSVHNLMTYWGWVGAVTIVASIFELGFLYLDGLRAVHRMACTAGLAFETDTAQSRDAELLSTLARAALELPNPPKPLDGIDPLIESSAFFIFAVSLLYKAKIALTTFLVKALLRGVLGRIAARAVLDFVGVPVTAIWNAIVCHYVLREARIRILGPFAVTELLSSVHASTELGRAAFAIAQRAAASAVVRSRNFHPNHLALIRRLNETLALEEVPEPDNTERFVHELRSLSAAEQTFALHVLVTASIVDGKLTRAERRLLRQAYDACGRELALDRIEAVTRAFRAGQPITEEVHLAVQGPVFTEQFNTPPERFDSSSKGSALS